MEYIPKIRCQAKQRLTIGNRVYSLKSKFIDFHHLVVRYSSFGTLTTTTTTTETTEAAPTTPTNYQDRYRVPVILFTICRKTVLSGSFVWCAQRACNTFSATGLSRTMMMVVVTFIGAILGIDKGHFVNE